MPQPYELAIATPTATPTAIQQLRLQAASLLLYSTVLNDPLGQAFLQMLDRLGEADDPIACHRAYSRWFSLLAEWGDRWRNYVQTRLLINDNPFTQQVQQYSWTDLPPSLIAAARYDLVLLQSLGSCSEEQACEWLQGITPQSPPPIPWQSTWQSKSHSKSHDSQANSKSGTAELQGRSHAIWQQFETAQDWGSLAEALADYHRQAGAGIFAQYRALRWQHQQWQGIAHPDPIRLDELAAYDIPRQALIQNTEALLAGYPALHVLLYGCRGSGKSSLVKALLNEYGDCGLRLVEVAKSELQHLPVMVDRMRDLPQKFIIFVDDLSFEEDDDVYKSLKVVLEGSLTARPRNVVVYATSNRRHLVRQFHGDRPRPKDAEEVSAWDTLQEKLSFSDRFGLTLTFEPADQATYLDIVFHLARQAQLSISEAELTARSLQWATRHNGRSGRSARQFIDALTADLKLRENGVEVTQK